MQSLSLEEFIYQVKAELLEAQGRHEGEPGYLALRGVDLEVCVAVTRAADGTVKLAVVELGGKADRAETHTVRLAFDVGAPAAEPGAGGNRAGDQAKVRRGGRAFK